MDQIQFHIEMMKFE